MGYVMDRYLKGVKSIPGLSESDTHRRIREE